MFPTKTVFFLLRNLRKKHCADTLEDLLNKFVDLQNKIYVIFFTKIYKLSQFIGKFFKFPTILRKIPWNNLRTILYSLADSYIACQVHLFVDRQSTVSSRELHSAFYAIFISMDKMYMRKPTFGTHKNSFVVYGLKSL